MGWITADERQTGILADRYLDVLLGDPGGLLLLVVQSPAIALLIAGVWSNVDADSRSLYFVLCLSAFFLGAINACREIVKEREIFLRERMFNLSVASYVRSKLRVQLIVVVLSSALLAGVVRWFIPMKVSLFWVGIALVATSAAGTAVGLFISAFVRTPDKAVMAVPLVVIPQILFSDFVIGDRFSGWTEQTRNAMPVYWAYRALEEVREPKTEWFTVLLGVAILAATVYLFYLLTVFVLSRAKW